MTRTVRPVLDFSQPEPRANGVRASADGGVLIDPSNPAHLDWLRQAVGGGPTASGGVVTESTAMKIAAVWRCVHIVAGVPANMPMDVRRRVSERESRSASDHQAYELMVRRPNHWQTPQDFKRMLTAHVALRGNGYAVKVPGLRGVQALWPIHPDRMRPQMSSDMELTYEYTSPRGVKRTLPQDGVMHIRGLSFDGISGVGVLQFARETMGMAQQAQLAAAKMWKQGAMTGGALQHKGRLSDEAYGRLRQSLDERNSGAENAGKWMILEEGMEASQVALTAEDMQFLESRQFDRGEIAMFFGVPPHMIGDTDKSTSWGSGIEQQKDGFVAFTEEDYLTAWEQTCARDLLTPAEARQLYFRFNRAALIRGDIKTRYEAYGIAIEKRIFTPNEVRELEDRNPRVGGDDFADQPTSAGPAPSADLNKDPANAK